MSEVAPIPMYVARVDVGVCPCILCGMECHGGDCKHALIAESDGLFKLACCHQSCHITMIRALHLLLTVHPLDNYPTPLICLHEGTHQDLLFSCCVDLQPSVALEISIDIAKSMLQWVLKG